LIIEARHISAPDKYKIEIASDKVGTLTSEFGGDFGFMSGFLKILNKRMVLLNPVSKSLLTFLRNSNKRTRAQRSSRTLFKKKIQQTNRRYSL
jgi:hypothetical protein